MNQKSPPAFPAGFFDARIDFANGCEHSGFTAVALCWEFLS
jgi:hypothetical protein